MDKPKIGKSAEDIFSRKPSRQEQPASKSLEKTSETKQEVVEQEKRSRGRPVEHKESVSKVTVVLLDNQIHWLGKLSSEIRLKTKSAISRAELIRAFISAIETSGLDLSDISTEQAIKEFLLSKLKHKN
jgi:hypothetical protein